VTRALLITAITLGAIGFLVWIASYCVPLFIRRADALRLIARWLFTFSCAAFVVHTGIISIKTGNLWPLMRSTLALAVVITVCWGHSIAGGFAGFLTSAFDGGNERVKAQPLYSAAEAKRKRGLIREAMYEVQAQLEKFPNDFRGQMLLAGIQAENANDLPGAEATIHRICSQPKHAPNQIAGALASLADWHLRLDQDVDAARAALEEIVQRFPETDLASRASNRLAHLADTATLVDSRAPRTIVMKPSTDVPIHKMDPAELLPLELDPEAEAARLSAHLTQFPSDTEARELLAKIYVNHYGRLDLASEQMDALINQPGELPRRVAQWMNLLADLQIRATGETELAAATLHRLIEQFPTHGFADVARQRLASLNLEVRRFQKDRVVKFDPS